MFLQFSDIPPTFIQKLWAIGEPRVLLPEGPFAADVFLVDDVFVVHRPK